MYGVHLLAWLLIAVALQSPLGGVLQRGGLPPEPLEGPPALQRGDQPANWPSQRVRWRRRRALHHPQKPP